MGSDPKTQTGKQTVGHKIGPLIEDGKKYSNIM
jgi:hypothetical protein